MITLAAFCAVDLARPHGKILPQTVFAPHNCAAAQQRRKLENAAGGWMGLVSVGREACLRAGWSATPR